MHVRKKKTQRDPLLTPEEKEILESVERGEWVEVPNMAEEIKKASEYARYTLEKMRKNQRMNLRISDHDVARLQKRANEEGLPYQTLATSILHRYLTGRLVEKR